MGPPTVCRLHARRDRARQRRPYRWVARLRPGESDTAIAIGSRFFADTTSWPSEMLPRVHRVVSLLKRWLLGTHQGAVSRAHLDYYLDEFTFRFNRRRRGIAASCFTVSSNRRSPSSPRRTDGSSNGRRRRPRRHNRLGSPESSG